MCAQIFPVGVGWVAPAICDLYVTMTNTAKFFELGFFSEDHLRGEFLFVRNHNFGGVYNVDRFV